LEADERANLSACTLGALRKNRSEGKREVIDRPAERVVENDATHGPDEIPDDILSPMTDKIVVLSVCDSEEEAARIARVLVERGLASCVNILPQARSIYRWKNKIEDAREFVLLIKSRRDVFDALRTEIVKMHSYEIPEVIALPIVDGSDAYLAWLDRELCPRSV
jgi:periplasmic divalent cation tolerance protein